MGKRALAFPHRRPATSRMGTASDLIRSAAGAIVELMDRLPDVVFFVKDSRCRYVAVNDTLARRLALASPEEAIGRTAAELFPAPLGRRFLAQDQAVLRAGRPLDDELELHLYPDGGEGWCVTSKLPLRDERGAVIGVLGTSRDVHAPAAGSESLAELAGVVRHIHEAYDRPLKVEELAARARLSEYQLARRVKALFGLSPAQLVIKTRIDAARRRLAAGDETIATIALACGYCDQSAFTRQFKAVAGVTPLEYRRRKAVVRGS
jgi:PAS domain S-box-containing protein